MLLGWMLGSMQAVESRADRLIAGRIRMGWMGLAQKRAAAAARTH
jgi:hypothetical protein